MAFSGSLGYTDTFVPLGERLRPGVADGGDHAAAPLPPDGNLERGHSSFPLSDAWFPPTLGMMQPPGGSESGIQIGGEVQQTFSGGAAAATPLDDCLGTAPPLTLLQSIPTPCRSGALSVQQPVLSMLPPTECHKRPLSDESRFVTPPPKRLRLRVKQPVAYANRSLTSLLETPELTDQRIQDRDNNDVSNSKFVSGMCGTVSLGECGFDCPGASRGSGQHSEHGPGAASRPGSCVLDCWERCGVRGELYWTTHNTY
jgi:hypothetical protein